MKLEIQEAIQSLVPPEQLKLILDAVDLLLAQDYILALDELNTVLMIADDNADMAMLVGRINDVLTYALNYILGEHGVRVYDEADLGVRVAIANAILMMPNWMMPEDLAHIFQQNYENEVTLSKLVAFLSTYPDDEVLEAIEEIDIHAFNVLRQRVDERIQVQGVYSGTRVPKERIQVINRLIKSSGREKFSMMLELADAGVRVGRPYDELLSISFESLESRNPEQAAAQLVGLAFFSDMPLQGIWPKLEATLDDYTDNPLERRMMSEEFTAIKRNLGEIHEIA